MALTRVPLKIPTGWKVNYNEFYEVEPELILNDDYEHKWEFKEGILQFSHPVANRILDLGWYPEFSPKGCFKLMLIDSSEVDGPDWRNPLYKFESRNLKEIIRTIEYILSEVSQKRKIMK